jgi:hypothetical protein
VGVAALALLSSFPAVAGAQTGLTATKIRPIVDTLTLVGPNASTTDQVGNCVQPQLRRIDCEVDHVAAADGALTCARIVTVRRERRNSRSRSYLSQGSYRCPLSATVLRVVRSRRISRTVLAIASRPPEVIVTCTPGAPGCPTADALRCPSASNCAPLRVSYCNHESASCPTVQFERCPPGGGGPCTQPATRSAGTTTCDPAAPTCSATPPSPDCLRDPTVCATTPVIDCANLPLQCAAAPTSTCTGLLECAPVLNLLGCATAVTPCFATLQPAGQGDVQSAAPPRRFCNPRRVQVLIKRPPPARRRTRLIGC